MKIFYLQLQSNRHICPHTSIVDEKFLSTILKKAWWWCRPPWWGCWPSWWGCWPPWWWCRPPWGWWGPQKHCWGVIKDDCCTEGRPEIGNPKVWRTNGLTYQLTNQLTWVGARDTCVSKKGPKNPGMGRPPPPHSGNARKKTFFFHWCLP